MGTGTDSLPATAGVSGAVSEDVDATLSELLENAGCSETFDEFHRYMQTGFVSPELEEHIDQNPACSTAFDAIVRAQLASIKEAATNGRHFSFSWPQFRFAFGTIVSLTVGILIGVVVGLPFVDQPGVVGEPADDPPAVALVSPPGGVSEPADDPPTLPDDPEIAVVSLPGGVSEPADGLPTLPGGPVIAEPFDLPVMVKMEPRVWHNSGDAAVASYEPVLGEVVKAHDENGEVYLNVKVDARGFRRLASQGEPAVGGYQEAIGAFSRAALVKIEDAREALEEAVAEEAAAEEAAAEEAAAEEAAAEEAAGEEAVIAPE